MTRLPEMQIVSSQGALSTTHAATGHLIREKRRISLHCLARCRCLSVRNQDTDSALAC